MRHNNRVENRRMLTEKFRELSEELDLEQKDKLFLISEKLMKNRIYIDHALLQLVCAKHLISQGYDVDVEYPFTNNLVCDVFARKNSTLVVEIETGYSAGSLEERIIHRRARDISKIARYSNISEFFAMGTVPTYNLQIPQVFLFPPYERDLKELRRLKSVCDEYYKKPYIDIEKIRNARLHKIYIIDVAQSTVKEVSPKDYVKTSLI